MNAVLDVDVKGLQWSDDGYAALSGALLDRALERSLALEWCSKVYLKALSGGSPNILSDDEMALAKEQMDSFEAKRREFRAV